MLTPPRREGPQPGAPQVVALPKLPDELLVGRLKEPGDVLIVPMYLGSPRFAAVLVHSLWIMVMVRTARQRPWDPIFVAVAASEPALPRAAVSLLIREDGPRWQAISRRFDDERDLALAPEG